MPSQVLRRLSALALVWAVAVTPRSAAAQVDAAAARQLFEEGRTLAAQGNFSAACPKFEQSYQRDPGIGTLFNLADCWQHLGRSASAWAKFRDVADEAARTNQTERQQVALKRAAELMPQLSKIVVHFADKDPNLQVLRDGIAMTPSDTGVATALDPGEHRLEAKAPGKRPWSSAVTIPPNGQTVEVTVPVLEPVGQAAPTVPEQPASASPPNDGQSRAVPVVTTGASAKPLGSDEAPATSSSQRTLAYVAGGLGVVGLTVGTVFGLRVGSKNDKADSICPSGRDCTSQNILDYEAAISDAKSARTLSYVGFGVGGAALVTGAILLLTAPKSKTTALQFAPSLQPGQFGGAIRTVF